MGGAHGSSLAVWIAALLSLTACHASSSRPHGTSNPDRHATRFRVPAAKHCNASVALLVGLSAPREPTRCTAALIGPRTAVPPGTAWLGSSRAGAAVTEFGWGSRRPTVARPSGSAASESARCRRPTPACSHPTTRSWSSIEDAARPSIPLGEGDVAFGEVVRWSRSRRTASTTTSTRCAAGAAWSTTTTSFRRGPGSVCFDSRPLLVPDS